MRPPNRLVLILVPLLLAASDATALERLCDPSFENCRTEVIERIRAETVEISVAAWFYEDARFTNELILRWRAGVRVRVLGDPRANTQHPANAQLLTEMANAGVPIRKNIGSGIEHWKLMLFAGQDVVYFGSANFSGDAFVPLDPYRNYVDETIYGTSDPQIVNSFRTKYDDAWTNTTLYANYANAPNSSLARHYSTYPIDPALNFAPASGSASYRSRSVVAYNAESAKIDVIMYRITDQAHVDALIAAHRRGVPVRIYTEQEMYRDPTQLWHSMSIDKLYMAGIPIRDRGHAGLNHEKLVLLYGQRTTIFGSSNMTSKSSDAQHEHNYFTAKAQIFEWFVNQFERKWNNAVGALETKPFEPLPPDPPVYASPADGAVGAGTTGARLTWYGGPWAHNYDIYFGVDPDPPLLAANVSLGPSTTTSQRQSLMLPALASSTTYYWRIVSRTIANRSRSGPVWRFTTSGTGGTTATDRSIVDFNRDGLSDLVWQRSDGSLVAWLMSGTTLSGAYFMQPAVTDANWRVATVADFDGDGTSDLLWRHRLTGELLVWFMNGVAMRTWSWLEPRVLGDLNWHLAGAGDFNGDRSPDLVWQNHRTGQMLVWYMRGIALASWRALSPATLSDLNWRIEAVADFDRNGTPDLFWQNRATGGLLVWFMNGTTMTRFQWLNPSANADRAWAVVGAADLNKDGRPDLVWQNQTDGRLIAWFLNGTSLASWRYFAPSVVEDQAWRVVAVR